MMNIQLPHAIGGALLTLSLACPTPDAPDAPPAPIETECPAHRAVLMTMWDASTLPCNPDGTQILVTTIDDDPGPTQELNCNDSGGQVLYLPESDIFLCIDIDY